MKPDDSTLQTKHEAPASQPETDNLTEPPSRRLRGRPRRNFGGGFGAMLLIDALALLLIAASGPAAYLWLDRNSGPATSALPARPTPTAAPDASPSAGGSSQPGAQSSASAVPSPSLVYGEGNWATADPLPRAVWASTSTVLRDGRILVVGGAAGISSRDAVATADVFDPATGHWTRVTDMLQRRAYAMAVTLADGSVLVAGGARDSQPLDTAERYYPDAGTWVAAGRLNLPRTQGSLTLLPDGRAMVTGGGIEGGPGYSGTASTEIFNPKTGRWTIAAPMAVARVRHTATLLNDGELLVAGGATTYHLANGKVTAQAEIYNPKSNAWRAAASMSRPRYVHGAVLLADGRVLVAGGWYSESDLDPAHETADIYDPATDRWTPTGSMINARAEYGIVRLPDGRVLAAGGIDLNYKALGAAELFDPSTGVWTATGSLKTARMWPITDVLPDGRVLIGSGGLDAGANKVTATCEIYTPPTR